MTRDEMKAQVAFLLRTIAERVLEGTRPDYVVGFEVSRTSQGVWGWERRYDAAVAERAASAQAEYEAWGEVYERSVRRIMTAEWNELKAHGMGRLRLALASKYVTPELRHWAMGQYVRLRSKPDALAIAYLVLVLRDAAEWEAAHDADAAESMLDDCVTRSYGDERGGEYDGPGTDTWLSGVGSGQLHVVGAYRGNSRTRRVG